MTTKLESTTVVTLCMNEAPPVSVQPEVRLERWAIHEAGSDLYLIGWNVERDGPRSSSPITQFDR